MCVRSSEWKPPENLELLHFLTATASVLGKTADFKAPKIDWACGAAPKDTFGERLLEFVHAVGGASPSHPTVMANFRSNIFSH